MSERLNNLLTEINKLHRRQKLSKTVTPGYFEPGMMEYLDKSDGIYDSEKGEIILCFDPKGTRYEGRTELMKI